MCRSKLLLLKLEHKMPFKSYKHRQKSWNKRSRRQNKKITISKRRLRVVHAFQTTQAEKQTLEKTLQRQESQKGVTTVEQSERESRQRLQEANTQIELLQQRVQVADHRIEEAKSGANEVKQGSRKTESDPSWVVRRDEILFTDEELGRGGWAVVKVAKFRAIRVAAKCLYEQIVSNYNRLPFIREMNMASI